MTIQYCATLGALVKRMAHGDATYVVGYSLVHLKCHVFAHAHSQLLMDLASILEYLSEVRLIVTNKGAHYSMLAMGNLFFCMVALRMRCLRT